MQEKYLTIIGSLKRCEKRTLMMPHFHLTRRRRLWLFTPEQDDIPSLLTHFIIPSITPRRCSIFRYLLVSLLRPSEVAVGFREAQTCSSVWLSRSHQVICRNNSEAAGLKKQTEWCFTAAEVSSSPPNPPSRHDASVKTGIYDWGPECISVAGERRLLSHRSGDLPPISLISDRMEGEGSVGGAEAGFYGIFFQLKWWRCRGEVS